MSRQISIAIIDDHTMFRRSLSILVDLFPLCKVRFDSANGRDFISQLDRSDLPDIVLMDIYMPIMDGYETTEWLKKTHPQVKVLALSTMHSESAIIKMIKLGARGYLLKDADSDELKQAIEEVATNGFYYNELVSKKIVGAVNQLTDSKSELKVFANLSQREIQFLKLACSELTYKEIADKLFVSVRTVEGYRDTLCEKLGLKTRVGLVMYAIRNNIVALK